MNKIITTIRILTAVGILFIFSLTIGSTRTQAAGTCALTAGQVVINEISPKTTGGVDWIELYNKTASQRNLSNCFIDDVAGGGGSPVRIPAGTTVPAHGFWVFERSNYFNNGGDEVRLLDDDGITVLDAHTYTDPDNYDYVWYRDPDGGEWKTTTTSWPTRGASNAGSTGVCGTGTWQAGFLEIHHINVGQGDSTLIVGPTGKSLLFDVAISEVGPYVRNVLGCMQLDYVLISHFHEDHIGRVDGSGLWHLVERQGFTVGQTLIRDYNTYRGNSSGTLENWKAYLENRGGTLLHPVTAVEGTGQLDLGAGVVFEILTVDGNGQILPGNFSMDASPPSENDYSIGTLLSFGDFDEWIGGDLDGHYDASSFGYTYHDIELSVAPEANDVDVYRVNHHGSEHSNNSTFLAQLDPEVSIISVGENNGYGHPAQTVIDGLLGTSDVYMTERGDPETDTGNAVVAGDIVIKTTGGTSYTVNGNAYTATEPARTDADGDGYFDEADPDDSNPNILPSPNGGCDPLYQDCLAGCAVTGGQVVVNEILPAPSPSTGPEWVELYNTTGNAINIGYCYIDDIDGGSTPYEIPGGAIIPAHGFWTMDFTSYFNNTGDDVRFLKDDLSTVLDSHSFGSTGYDLSWYRNPDGGAWALDPTAEPTKGSTNIKKYKSNLKSSAAQDGWILESAETSNKGGTLSSTATTFYLGDNAQKKQYRSILSFSTKGLPDNAVITKVTLKVKKQGIVGGGNPVNTFQGFLVDLKKGFFGSAPGLQVSDFQAGADKSYGPFKPALANGWYAINLTQAKAYINKRSTGGGVTQLRLRFKLDDNNNAVANYLKLYSGNAPAASRPQLIIEYYVP